MKKQILVIIIIVLIAVPINSKSFFTNLIERIMASRILNCKDVTNVTVIDKGEEKTNAEIIIELTNDRLLHFDIVDFKLTGCDAIILAIGDIKPVAYRYICTKQDSDRLYCTLGLDYLNVVQCKFIDERINPQSIIDFINNYDFYNSIISNLPEFDINLPKVKFIEQENKYLTCEIWENVENPFSYKKIDSGYKFFKTSEKEFSEYQKRNYQ